MRCKKARAIIQDWFDTRGGEAMPSALRDHVRVCMPCRDYIGRWNSIELRLQSIRDESPRLSSNFDAALQARLRAETAPKREYLDGRRWFLTLVGTSAVILITLILLRLTTDLHHPANSQQLLVTTTTPRSIIQKSRGATSAPPLPSSLPLADETH